VICIALHGKLSLVAEAELKWVFNPWSDKSDFERKQSPAMATGKCTAIERIAVDIMPDSTALL